MTDPSVEVHLGLPVFLPQVQTQVFFKLY